MVRSLGKEMKRKAKEKRKRNTVAQACRGRGDAGSGV
jgi:hypothetical protein